jgi:hypothetical protein
MILASKGQHSEVESLCHGSTFDQRRLALSAAKNDVPLRASQQLLSQGVEPSDMPSSTEMKRQRATHIRKSPGEGGGVGLGYCAFTAWLDEQVLRTTELVIVLIL